MDSVIIEIRAGAGGEEAALFAKNLYKMYFKYSLLQNWSAVILDESESPMGGYKQITIEIKGNDVMQTLQHEAGVHRVQRVPQTEKSNRIHTSTASVAVLKKPKESEITLNHSDLKFDFFRSSGKGGQNVNKRQTAIRITHIPSGMVVTSQTQRHLEQNRQAALSILQAKLFEQAQNKTTAGVSEQRREQIGTAERAEKIRTYNFPQDRITDHRINKSLHNIEKIMEGKMEPLFKKLAVLN